MQQDLEGVSLIPMTITDLNHIAPEDTVKVDPMTWGSHEHVDAEAYWGSGTGRSGATKYEPVDEYYQGLIGLSCFVNRFVLAPLRNFGNRIKFAYDLVAYSDRDDR